MDPHERVIQHFHESIRTKQMAMDQLSAVIVAGAQAMARCLQHDGKILSCGNGGSAAHAQQFSSKLLNRFDMERPGLPAVALTTDSSTITSIATDYQYADVFAKQIRALGHRDDVLLVMTTDGEAPSVLAAVQAGHERGMRVVVLSGGDGGSLTSTLDGEDIEIRVPATDAARVEEVHSLIIHCLCDLIDQHLFNPE